ncbi:putative ribosome biogenesis ATPase nvl [Lasiodiplodia theobromae]|uniref:Putative ribosome biogenesis ATPase nvl n=1 Tax=Lasiodiplodia theobromae TaxID=45133 RepID=A0A5N5DGC1_9PEZI|nr:putative ribosome biogenesis ATPase nvl [Lasiodiplodia theobromae]
MEYRMKAIEKLLTELTTTSMPGSLPEAEEEKTLPPPPEGEKALSNPFDPATQAGQSPPPASPPPASPARRVSLVPNASPIRKDSPVRNDTPVGNHKSGREDGHIRNDSVMRSDTPIRNDTPVRNDTAIRNDTPVSDKKPVREEPHIRNDSVMRNDSPTGNDTHTRNDTPRNETPTRNDMPARKDTSARHNAPIIQQSVTIPKRQGSVSTPPVSHKSHIEFDELCSLFEECQMAITSDRKQASKVVDVSLLPENGTSHGALKIRCVHLDYDGQFIGPVHTQFKIKKYSGARRVTTLPVHPYCMNVDPAGVRETLVVRGKKFMEVAAGKHMHCRGTAISPREQVDAQVMVDFQQAISRHPHWAPAIIGVGADIDDEDNDVWELCREKRMPDAFLQPREMSGGGGGYMGGAGSLSEDELMLLPYRVYGFVLRTRKWAAFDIDDLHEVRTRPGGEGFKQLVLPSGHRSKLEPLLRHHFRQRQCMKAEQNSPPPPPGTMNHQYLGSSSSKQPGLTILLHGVPGVGKTLTAECVASHFSKPFFPLSCSTILAGSPEDVTARIEEVFSLAAAWDAVLLLEDAEPIVLHPSTLATTTFLHALDNYPGLLFLHTTSPSHLNPTINPSLHTRLRLSLSYPPLNERATLDVWDVGIWQTKQLYPSTRIKADEILSYAAERYRDPYASRWTGRMIHNAFQNAVALAEDEALYSASGSIREHKERRSRAGGSSALSTATLRRRHFEIVAGAWDEFERSAATASGGGVQAGSRSSSSHQRDRERERDLPLPPPPPPQQQQTTVTRQQSVTLRAVEKQQRSASVSVEQRRRLVRANTIAGGQVRPPSRAAYPSGGGKPPLPKMPSRGSEAPLPPLPPPQLVEGHRRRMSSQMHVSHSHSRRASESSRATGTTVSTRSGGGGAGSRYALSSGRQAKHKRWSSSVGEEGEEEGGWSETRGDSGAEEWSSAEVERNLIDNFTAIAYR